MGRYSAPVGSPSPAFLIPQATDLNLDATQPHHNLQGVHSPRADLFLVGSEDKIHFAEGRKKFQHGASTPLDV